MQSLKYLEQSNFDIWHYHKNRSKHRQRLKDISQRASKKLDQTQSTSIRRAPGLKNYSEIRTTYTEKQHEIQRGNECLAEKLLKISHRVKVI